MAIAPVKDLEETDVSRKTGVSVKSHGSSEAEGSLVSVRAALVRATERLASSSRTLSTSQAVQALVEVEDISRIVDHLQVITAGMAMDLDLASAEQRPGSSSLSSSTAQALEGPATATADASTGTGAGTSTGAGAGERPAQRCAQYLRARLGISRAEAKRRLVLAQNVLPGTSVSGAHLDPPLQTLSVAVASGEVSGRAATIICAAVDRVRCVAVDEQLAQMERQLTLQASESDEDVLRSVARYWEAVLDQDGQEPTEKILRARQGVFLRGRRHGLHMLEIGATAEQFEHLVTVMNTATNPRSPGHGRSASDTGSGDTGRFVGDTTSAQDLAESADGAGGLGEVSGVGGASSEYDGPEAGTRAQRMLDGLVGACRIALSGTQLPATGGHRPQVMVTIDYRDLLADLTTRNDCSPGSARSAGNDGTAGARSAGNDGSAASFRSAGNDGSAASAASSASIGGAGNADEAGDNAGPCTRNQAWFGPGSGSGSGSGRAVFAERMSARSIRRLACDADIIPLVLGGDGRVLDVGRASRLFPPHLRRALVARDIGCAFPDCTVPASWCEAHHITPWAHGGNTSIDNGVLLCAHHHHIMHQGHWTVESRNGMPWFTPPPHLARHGTTPRRNRYWNVRPDLLTGTRNGVDVTFTGVT